ncbi:amidohydrolase family protein [Marinimicrococcus flavescens]|uniref:Amidohydrolase family protein n=1 Tax=Marinimicrococcus flavescens TaxID=3031815 RepID=A0AAP3XSV5_9PROT|nr:amidohydrolase family protein [Marinimicrococcus flavescens]
MTNQPRLRAPAGATDTHMHFYGPYDRFPLAPTSPNSPPPALLDDYRAVQKKLGLERVVVVQPAGYAFDNRCTMAAVEAIGPAARAVVVVEPDAPQAELEALTHDGAVGLRVFMLPGGVYRWEDIPGLAEKTLAVGWHLQLQCDGRLLPEHMKLLEPLAGRLVIDHNGKFLEPVPVDDPGFACLLRLVDKGAYVKLSAPYETSREGPPVYGDVGALARELVRHAPERMLWASNWPHPGRDPRPDDVHLLDLLLDWAPREEDRQRILVDNPARLYGFS